MSEDMEGRLRVALAARAAQAPTGEGLAEQIIVTAQARARGSERSRRTSWRTWTMPLIAAGSVAAVVGAVLGVGDLHHSAAPQPPAVSPILSPAPSVSPGPTPSPSGVVPGPGPSATSTVSSSALRDIHVVDTTFVGAQVGWALVTADCLSEPGTCLALLRTTDGTDWLTVPGGHSTPFNLADASTGCSVKCVTGIRFATNQIGYAYGPSAFFLTENGGQSWTYLPDQGALALETLDGNVIRLVSPHSGCPGPCGVQVQYAATGARGWTTVALAAGTLDAGTLSLARTGADAFVALSPGSAASPGPARLFVSRNAGHSWVERSDPCPSALDGAAGNLAVAADGSLSLLCGPGSSGQVIETSTNGALSFTASPTLRLPGVSSSASAALGPLGAASARTFLLVAGPRLYRSADGGADWVVVLSDPTATTQFAPGFETLAVGRWLAVSTGPIWTTRNAGRTWTASSV